MLSIEMKTFGLDTHTFDGSISAYKITLALQDDPFDAKLLVVHINDERKHD